jgi:flagellar basal-body rod modification protein FlgD
MMMDVAQATSASQSFGGASVAEETTDETNSDYDTFLLMLTTQMKNQDPSEPMDSADFAVDLATFSAVEQQVTTNELLQEMMTALSSSGLGDLATWVGMEALSDSPAYFDGTPVTVYPETESGAITTTLQVKNDAGAVVDTVEFSKTEESLTWVGVTDAGDPMPSGNYTFEVQNFDKDGELLGTSTVQSYSEVVEARMADGASLLVLRGGATIVSTDAAGVRNPQSLPLVSEG